MTATPISEPSNSEIRGFGQTEKIGFLLLPEFPIYAFVLAVEALRVANQNAGDRLFSSYLITTDGKPVGAGNGMAVTPDLGIADAPSCRRSSSSPAIIRRSRSTAAFSAGSGVSTATAPSLAPSTPDSSPSPRRDCSTASRSRFTGKRSPCSRSTTRRSRPARACSSSTATASPAPAASPPST